jgi:hypothetical protein
MKATIDEVKAVINKFFSDSSRPRSATRDGLVEVIDECRVMLQALREDEEREREEQRL